VCVCVCASVRARLHHPSAVTAAHQVTPTPPPHVLQGCQGDRQLIPATHRSPQRHHAHHCVEPQPCTAQQRGQQIAGLRREGVEGAASRLRLLECVWECVVVCVCVNGHARQLAAHCGVVGSLIGMLYGVCEVIPRLHTPSPGLVIGVVRLVCNFSCVCWADVVVRGWSPLAKNPVCTHLEHGRCGNQQRGAAGSA